MVKNLPATQESRVWSLGWEGPVEKGKAAHSSILAWRIPGAEEPGSGFFNNWAIREAWHINVCQKYKEM